MLLADPSYREELESSGLPTAGLVRFDEPVADGGREDLTDGGTWPWCGPCGSSIRAGVLSFVSLVASVTSVGGDRPRQQKSRECKHPC